jgi:phosphoribosylglycinamide formyltransferase-1
VRGLRLGVLGSGQGSNFVALARAIERDKIPAEIVWVGSDRAEAKILEHAKKLNLPRVVCRKSNFRTKLEPEIEEELALALEKARVDLLVLAGYMRVVKDPLLRKFEGRMINIHPSLLPAFPGLRAWEQARMADQACRGVHGYRQYRDRRGYRHALRELHERRDDRDPW